MIKINRNSAPLCLTKKDLTGVPNYKRWAIEWDNKVKANPTTRDWQWHSYNGKSVDSLLVERLRLITNDHCSFCDRYAPEEDSDSIEHFKPKKPFPLLSFSWSNLFLCCVGCQKRPKNWKKFEPKRNLILKPDVASYNFLKYFYYDTNTGRIEVNKFKTTPRNQEKAEITRIYYKFNDFNRPSARIKAHNRYFDNTTPNKIKPGLDVDDLPYRFMFR